MQVVTEDGTEQELELSADGTEITSGPQAKDEDVNDQSKHLERISAAQIYFEEAAETILTIVGGGRITELNLDSERGSTVWEADVLSGDNKHSVQIDAATGGEVSNTVDPKN